MGKLNHLKKKRRAAARLHDVVPVLPTLLTLGNAVCGLASITYAMQAGLGNADDASLVKAGLLIFAAMVFDMLDGMVARWTRQATQFGAQLDSLCDVVSFGIAPAAILLQTPDAWHARVVWVLAALFLSCVVMRLARFNVETNAADSHLSFSGLPSPAAAATIASFTIVAASASAGMLPEVSTLRLLREGGVADAMRLVLPMVALVLSGLMVSRIRYPHIVSQMVRSKKQFHQLIQIVFALAAIVALGEFSVPLLLCTFVFLPPMAALWPLLGRANTPSKARPAERQLTLPLSYDRKPRKARRRWPVTIPFGRRRA